MTVAKPPARDYFDARFQDLARHFTGSLGHLAERVDAGFLKIDLHLTEADAKLDALMEMVAVRQELRNLVPSS